MDPKGDKYVFASPYNYVLNNPIKAIDPDGCDIVVLNAPKGAQGYGHMAMLVGNDKTGWTFISKEGRARTNSSDRIKGRELIGGPASKPRIQTFNTKADFDKSKDLKDSPYTRYTSEVRYETSEEQDKAAGSATQKAANSWYNFIFSNCADAVSCGLEAAGLDPGYADIDTDVSINPLAPGKDRYDPTPNGRFKQIVKNNKEKEAKEEKTSNNNSNTTIGALINSWIQQNPNKVTFK